MTTSPTAVLAAHGSRSSEANDAHRAVTERVARTSGRRVIAAFLELAEPSIGDAIDQAASFGGPVQVLPYFLYPGRHVRDDIPAIVTAARQRHPGLEITLLPPFGADPRVIDLLAEQVPE